MERGVPNAWEPKSWLGAGGSLGSGGCFANKPEPLPLLATEFDLLSSGASKGDEPEVGIRYDWMDRPVLNAGCCFALIPLRVPRFGLGVGDRYLPEDAVGTSARALVGCCEVHMSMMRVIRLASSSSQPDTGT